MFKYAYPQFEKKHLLRGEMLEQLRDYPRNYLKMSFQGYGNGILAGCDISWDDERLRVSPGTILYKDNLYVMKDAYELECSALEKVRYLKVQFLAEEQTNESIEGNTRIFLDEEKPDSACEMELCRFRLQEGARLRDCHEGFEDFSTVYDTVNLIYAPYASEGNSTLNPILLMAFAREMIRKESREVMDTIFSMMILANNGHISAACIQEYLYARTAGREDGNIAMYRGLLEILKSQGSGENRGERANQAARSIMLL